jgi:hypothetical protein
MKFTGINGLGFNLLICVTTRCHPLATEKERLALNPMFPVGIRRLPSPTGAPVTDGAGYEGPKAENLEVYDARKVSRQLGREQIAAARCTVMRQADC